MQDEKSKKLSLDLIAAIFIVAFVGMFLMANYFFGFNLPLYLVAMSVGSAAAFLHPRAGLYAIIFLTFIFERFFTLAPIVMGRSEYKLYPIDVLIFALLAGIAFQIAARKLSFKFKKIDLAIFVFIAMSVSYFFLSTIVFHSNSSLTFSSSKNYAYYALLYFATFILINNQKHLKELAATLYAGAISILWFVFYGIVTGKGLWSDFTPLSTEGVRTLAFTHGFYLAMMLLLSLVYIAYRWNRFSKWLLILTPIWFLGVAGSMMRHLWISLFFAVIFLIVIFAKAERERIKKYATNYILIVTCLLVVIFYGATLFPRSEAYESLMNSVGMFSSRVTSITNTGGDESIIWRSAVWQQSIKQYVSSPLIGIGYGKLVSVEIGKYHDFVEIRNIHNSFLVILVQMGIMGLGSLAAAIIFLGYPLLKKKFSDDTWQIASSAAMGILLMQIIAFMFQPYLEANLLSIFFWINLGLLRRLQENQAN